MNFASDSTTPSAVGQRAARQARCPRRARRPARAPRGRARRIATTCASFSGSSDRRRLLAIQREPVAFVRPRVLRRRQQRRRRQDRRELRRERRDRASASEAGARTRRRRRRDRSIISYTAARRPRCASASLDIRAAPRIRARRRSASRPHPHRSPEERRCALSRLARRARRSCAAARCAVARGVAQTTLKMNISVAQNSHYGVAIDTFAREVEKRTNGRYKIQNFYAGALGAERESIEGVQLGTLDLTMTSTGPVPNFVPEVAILDIPFLFRDYAHARAVLDGPIGQDMLQKFPPKGIVALALGRERLSPHDQQQAPGQRARRPEGPQDAHDGEPDPHPGVQAVRHPARRRWRSPRCSPRCSRARSTARRIRCR